ncbi:MAG: RNA polymerase sigma-70 factor [Tannerellaceae bacterium]|jgi:RNA polymerase sigma-70 factor (ECF subfamily)|nr:RNA polymerase sigma-70 factor [Tannerellaceae bacterium]
MPELDDTDVKTLEALKQGDTKAFEIVYQTYKAKIYNFVSDALYDKNVAKDITQNVFLAVWEHRADILPNSNFKSYLFTIAKNLVYRQTEKMLLAVRYEDYIRLHNSEEDNSLEEKIDANSLETLIAKLIEQLPAARRKIFLLRFKKGLSNKEIVEHLSVSEGTVEKQINRSLTYIRKHLKDYINLIAMLHI